ncbi:MAG TPA: hypoxanthine phosphoribosyltransferase [Candidatus Limnocylindrales bacterium]|nr:hypoxanthine phosphoribosyltransferase [Candidatus Limnocylindrales bacterium]
MLSNDIQEILVSTDQIQRRVKELGEAISRDYRDKEPILISILKGAVFFLADLARAISIHISLDFMAISSYGDSQKTSGVVRILKDLDETITGREILIVEDIIDTGLTLRYLLNNLEARKPASLKICTLLDKPFRRIVKLPIAYQGFEIPDKFVVGYGLDYKQRYRNLPFIGVLKPELLEDR